MNGFCLRRSSFIVSPFEHKPFSLTHTHLQRIIHTAEYAIPFDGNCFIHHPHQFIPFYMHRFFGPDYIVIVTDLWICCTTEKIFWSKTKTQKLRWKNMTIFGTFNSIEEFPFRFAKNNFCFPFRLQLSLGKEKIYISFCCCCCCCT